MATSKTDAALRIWPCPARADFIKGIAGLHLIRKSACASIIADDARLRKDVPFKEKIQHWARVAKEGVDFLDSMAKFW
jgi:hypothetical protein